MGSVKQKRDKIKYYRTFKKGELVIYDVDEKNVFCGILLNSLKVGKPARIKTYYVSGVSITRVIKPTKLNHPTKKQKIEFTLKRLVLK